MATDGALDAAAVARGLHRIRGWVDLIRNETPPGHMAHAHAGLALVGIADLVDTCERDEALGRQVAVVTFRAAVLGGADYRLDVLAEHLQDVPGLIDLERVGVETRPLAAPYRGGPVFARGGPDATEAGDEC